MENVNIYRFGTIFRRFGTFAAAKIPKRRTKKDPKLKTVVCMLFMYMSHLFYHKWKCLLMNIRMQSVFGVFIFYFPSIITKKKQLTEAEVDLVWQRQRQAEAEVEKPHLNTLLWNI